MTEPVLSIVVPVLNEAQRLPALLQSLKPLRDRGAQLIIADGGSDDDSLALAEGCVDKLVHGRRGRAVQMNAGAGVAGGEFLLFLHADTRLPNDITRWYDSFRESGSHWGFFPVCLDGHHRLLRWVERGMNWRSRTTSVATGDQAMWMRRELFEQLGGFPDLALMEDVAMSKRLRQFSAPAIWSTPLCASSRRWEQKGVLRTIGLMWWLRLLYFCGVSPDRLVRSYYGSQVSEG